MTTATGTVATGTIAADIVAANAAAVERSKENKAIAANDTKLIAAFNKCAHKANDAHKAYLGSMGRLALTIQDLHSAGTWARQTDPKTGKLYRSAKTFYRDLFDTKDADGEPLFAELTQNSRKELITLMLDGGKLVGIGTNELAELIGCDAAQVTRTVKQIKSEQQAIEAAKPVARTDDELDAIAAEAAAEAAANGADEKTAQHAGEQARAEAKHADEQAGARPVLSEEEQAKLDIESDEQARKDADKAARAWLRATGKGGDGGLVDAYHLLTAERQAEVFKLAQDIVRAMEATNKGVARNAAVRASNAAADRKAS